MVPVFVPMLAADVAAIAIIEAQQHLTPWHDSSFEDALRSGWHAVVLRDAGKPEAPILGYFVAMTTSDDEELLTVTVAPVCEGRGCGRLLVERLVQDATDRGAERLFLEVRQSNQRAIGLYLATGFTIVGMRKNYYAIPADPTLGRSAAREDAVLMARPLKALAR